MPGRIFILPILVILASLAPWFFRSGFFAPAIMGVGAFLSLPLGAEGPRQVRPIETVSGRTERSEEVRAMRSPAQGEARPFTTAARSLLRRQPEGVAESARTIEAAGRTRAKLERDFERLGLDWGAPVFLRIFKDERELELWVESEPGREFALFRVYRVRACSDEAGPKETEGDGRSPEGFYYVPPSRMIPDGPIHLGFDLGYPNAYDRVHGSGGEDMLVHGGATSAGAYAMGDPAIEEIYTIAAAALKGGQPFFRVHCFPFRMRDRVMDEKLIEHPAWESFWANLKEGYDFFEILRRPPDVSVTGEGRYAFSRE